MEKGILELLKRTTCKGFKLNDCEPELQQLVSHLDGFVSFESFFIYKNIFKINFNQYFFLFVFY